MKDSRELTDVRKELELLADEPYRVFHSRLLPGTENTWVSGSPASGSWPDVW